MNFDFDRVEALLLVRRYHHLRYFNTHEVGNLILQSKPTNITRPQTPSSDAHTLKPSCSFSSLSLTLVKWLKSCPVFRVLLASILVPSQPPVPRSPIKICTTFAMKQQATLHNGCASRVLIRTGRVERVEESSAFDDQHAARS